MTTRTDIANEAKKWIGVKFKRGGRDRTGVDCIGLLVGVGRAFNFNISDTTEYSFNPEPEKFRELVYDQTVERSFDHIEPGTILIFRQSIFPMHTGIVTLDHYGRMAVTNGSAKERRVVEEPMDVWRGLIIGVRDYKEVA